MKALSKQSQASIQGGWGFLCGAAIALGAAAAITTGGLAVPAGMLAAEWGCALDVAIFY